MYETTPTPGWKRWRNRTVGPQRVHTPDPAIQPALDFERAARQTRRDDLTLAERFRQFHAANPGVYARMLDLARQAVAAGHKRISVKKLYEDIRPGDTSLAPGETYRLDNGYTAFYARLLAAADPDLAARIELRARRAQ